MTLPTLRTERLILTVPTRSDARSLLDYAVENQAFHGPWLPPAPLDWNTLANAKRRVAQYRASLLAGSAIRFWLREVNDPNGPYVGAVSLANIVMGPRRACTLGYHLAQRVVGRGYMHEAAGAALEHAFRILQLNRVEATYAPDNVRSARVLERLGFEQEGRARRYLFVNGQFQDHVLMAVLNPHMPDAEHLYTPGR